MAMAEEKSESKLLIIVKNCRKYTVCRQGRVDEQPNALCSSSHPGSEDHFSLKQRYPVVKVIYY